MHASKQRNHFFAFLLLLIISFNLKAAFAKDETANNPKTLNLSGLYFGFIPCDDCQGIKTTLALNANNSYVLLTQYAGKSDREFVEKGKFNISDNGEKLVLTPKKGGIDQQQYLIDDDMLVKLDEEGNRITKDGADRYILHRKDIVKKRDDSHGSH
jgi:copper homeostasis protein (lipoprotein)